MSKYPKSSYARHLKKLRTSYPVNISTRSSLNYNDDRFTQREFKMVLPLVLKDNISGKGSSVKPDYECLESMNIMVNCLKLNDYNESQCNNEVKDFLKCYQSYKTSLSDAIEQTKKGIFKIDEKQDRYPKNFVIKMLNQFKTPRKIDNGPEVKIK